MASARERYAIDTRHLTHCQREYKNQRMKETVHTPDHVREMMRLAIDKEGTQKAWADRHGVSQAYVSDVLLGRRDPSDAIAKVFGLEVVRRYIPLSSATMAWKVFGDRRKQKQRK